jgi:hypothetical protein
LFLSLFYTGCASLLVRSRTLAAGKAGNPPDETLQEAGT